MLALRAAWAAFHSYVVRAGFLEGGAGVLIAQSAAINATMGLALASEEDPARARLVSGKPAPTRTGTLPKSA